MFFNALVTSVQKIAIRLGNYCEKAMEIALFFGVLVMVYVVTHQVVMRYVFNNANIWADEAARLLMPWITMLGSAAAMWKADHITVDLPLDMLPRRVNQVVTVLRETAIIIMAGSLAYYGFGLMKIGGRQSTSALELSMSYPYASIPFGAVLIALMLVLKRLSAFSKNNQQA